MATQDIYAAARAHTQAVAPDVYVRPSDNAQLQVTDRQPINETPTQLLNMGFRQDENGQWVKENQPQQDIYAAARQATPEPSVEDARSLALRLDPQTREAFFGGGAAYQRSALEQAPFGDEITALIGGLVSGQGYTAARDNQFVMSEYDRQYNPEQRNLGGVAGFTAGLTVPLGRANNVRQAVGLGAGAGSVYGFAQGEGSFSDRLPGAVVGGVAGGVLGGGAQAASPYATRLIQGISGAGRNGTPQQQAAQRLRATMGGEDGVIMAERDRLTGLGLSPSIADVTGNTTERLIRTAATPAGPGSEVAVANLTARQSSLKPDVIRDVRQLSPVDQSADEFAQSLTQRRSALAREEYPGPYSQPVPVPDEVRALLTDEPGRAAIRAARANAVELRDEQRVLELDRLLSASAEGPLPEISAGTLDAVVIATRERARRFGERGLNARAAGATQRRQTIDSALDQVPGLDEARATYRGLSEQIDTLDPRNALDIFEDPRDFTRRIESLSPQAREAALVRVTQDLTDVLGGQRRAGTGTIDTATQAPYAQENLRALLGPERAQQFIDTLSARLQQTQRAARMSPNTNSQTASRLIDEDTFNTADRVGAFVDAGRAVTTGDTLAGARTLDRIVTGIRARGMSPEVRAEIVNLGLGSADDLERIILLADEARAAGRPVPRAVRQFIDRSSTQLGPAQADALRLALIPQRATAEEEGQQ